MLWIVGNSFEDTRDYLAACDITYGTLVDRDLPAKRYMASLRTVAVDFSSPEALIASVAAANIDITCLLAAGYDNYVLPAALLAEHYKVPSLSVAAATAATDKAVMRAAFAAYNPAITPDFAVATQWKDIEAFMAGHDYPVMLKPTNLMKSLYITKSNNLSELRANYNQLVGSLAAAAGLPYTLYPPRILIEECLIGSMHTVAGYVDATGNCSMFEQIVHCVTGQDVGKQENYIYSRQLPSSLDAATAAAVLDVARQGVTALALTSTMLHVELIVTEDGPKLIEIGARIGGYRTRMYRYAAGIDMNSQMLALAQGETPRPLATTGGRPHIAVIELFPDNEGNFVELQGQQQAERLASLQHLSVKAAPGQAVGRSSHGYKAAAVVIIGNSDAAQFTRDLRFINEQLIVVTAP